MGRAVSIHIGVNAPREGVTGRPLRRCEESAWRMAQLANQAGYDGLLVLRGPEATRHAVDKALSDAAQTLAGGDTLLVTFSGHGTVVADLDGDDHGWDEAWCLHDGILVDDKLAGFWRVFAPGVRIVVVSESCYSGDMLRLVELDYVRDEAAEKPRVLRSGPTRGGAKPALDVGRASCIGKPPADARGIQASVLLLAAATDEQKAQDGIYTDALLKVWNGGDFDGSYCDLHARVRREVMCTGVCHEPQIAMAGAPDPDFPLEPAFHVDRRTLRRPPNRHEIDDAPTAGGGSSTDLAASAQRNGLTRIDHDSA